MSLPCLAAGEIVPATRERLVELFSGIAKKDADGGGWVGVGGGGDGPQA